MRTREAIAERPLALDVAETGIVRRFLAFAQRADAEGRAQAVSALARAYLYSDLPPDTRAEVELGLAAVLDDPSALVRRALAEALASGAEAPRHIVLALAADQADVASIVLCRSPVLEEAELIDCAAVGDALTQAAIAGRPQLPAGLAAALAEIAEREAVIALLSNLDADLRESALWRIFERFGEDAEVREGLANRRGLPPALRNELAGATARALADFAARCDWLSPGRAQRIAREARDQATVTILSAARGEALAELARRMRSAGTLTIAVLMRALLSGDREFFIEAVSELSGVASRRVAAFARRPDGHGFAALYAKAKLPLAFLSAFRAALAGVATVDAQRGDRLSRALCQRTIEACQASTTPGLAPMLSLLSRFSAEAARDSAREYAAETWRSDETWRAAPRLERPSYAPLLIEAVALALEEFDAPPIELTMAALMGDDSAAPAVQLPAEMLAAIAEAA